ncbi:CHAT domain-containing protein [Cyathus striatus]|nr:CHAT domain-containing protein [Cyathus striatus]
MDLFKQTKEKKYVEKAIEAMEECIRISSSVHSELPVHLITLGRAYLGRFDSTNILDDADLSILTLQRADQMLDEDDPRKIGSLNLLGVSYLHRFVTSKEVSDLDEAISANAKAVDILHEDDNNPNVSGTITNLGYLWLRRFEESGKRDDITKALDLLERAKEHLPSYHPLYPTLLSHIRKAVSLQQNAVVCPIRYDAEENVDITALEDIITMTRRAVSLSKDDDGSPDRAGWLHDMSALLCMRFEWLGQRNDLDEALYFARLAIEITPESSFHYSMFINNLADLHMHMFHLTWNISSMDEALALARKGIEVISSSHPRFPFRMCYLSRLLLTRYEYTGSSEELSEALEVCQKAMSHVSDDHPDYPPILSNLGNILTQRYKRSGNLEDIDNAISYHTKALHILPNNAASLNNLAIAHQERFKLEGNPDDIEEAITAFERAVELSPDMHSDKGRRLSSLGGALQLKFYKNQTNPDIIDRAVEVQRKALSLLGLYTNSDMPGLLLNLAQALQLSFTHNENLESLEEAVECARKATKFASAGHSTELRFTCLYNLGACCYSMFLATRDATYINEAIIVQKEAVDMLDDGHPSSNNAYFELGRYYHSRWTNVEKSNEDIENMISAFQTAAKNPLGSSQTRMQAAEMWASVSRAIDIGRGMEGYKYALSLIPLVAWLGVTIEHRQIRIAKISNLSTQAAATACVANRYDLAIEWLEQGRSIVWRQLNELRTPVDDLRLENPDLAEELLFLSKELDIAGRKFTNNLRDPNVLHRMKMEEQQEIRLHHELAVKWDDLLNKVHNTPGFEDFLQPISFGDLAMRLPDSGPIVIINVIQERSDALIVIPDRQSIHHVQFIQPLYSKASAWHQEISKCIGSQNTRQNASDSRSGRPSFLPSKSYILKNVLGDIWDCLVNPVLKKLDYKPTSTPSRLWWCTTGPFTFIPLHAAGNYNDPNSSSRLTVSDYVISSYTPTLSALISGDNIQSGNLNNLLAVTVPYPDVPGVELPPIPSTVEEAKAVYETLHTSNFNVLRLEGEEAEPERVLKEMERYNCVHLACHGSQELTNPLKSALYLQNDKLELGDVIRKSMPNAKFAFLSACQTAMGVEALSEESVHLAAGMLAAGYKSVVGTMWPISDAHAVNVARDFYSYLAMRGLEIGNTAYALHHAVQNLRQDCGESDEDFKLWVPYIHIGQ